MTTEPQTSESQPTEPQPAETQPTEMQPAEMQPAEMQPAEILPAEMQPTELQPAETQPEQPQAPACRHEYVRIYQRKLKGLDRRLVATKAWLPVGFKMTDFSHLGEGSYCFCSKCRARLYPKRTNAEKAQARVALAASKLQQAADAADAAEAAELAEMQEDDSPVAVANIHVEELEVESVDLQDLNEGTVPVDDGSSCQLSPDDV
jgi:hypothetical protein